MRTAKARGLACVAGAVGGWSGLTATQEGMQDILLLLQCCQLLAAHKRLLEGRSVASSCIHFNKLRNARVQPQGCCA